MQQYRSLLAADTTRAKDHYAAIAEPRTLRLGDDEVMALTIDQAHTHLVVIVERDVHAVVTVELRGDIATHAQEIFLADGATLTLTLLCSSAAEQPWIAQRTQIGAHATLTLQNAIAHPRDLMHDLVSTVAGQGGTSTVEWMFRAMDTDRARLTARNVFTARDGHGEMTMRGIAEQKGTIRIEGMIDIEPGGNGTDTYLTQDVLMLDPTAKVDAVPGLTINTNDVKASHSATVSRVTADDLFYFASRGIDTATARAMYIEGYLMEMIMRMSPTIQATVRDALIA